MKRFAVLTALLVIVLAASAFAQTEPTKKRYLLEYEELYASRFSYLLTSGEFNPGSIDRVPIVSTYYGSFFNKPNTKKLQTAAGTITVELDEFSIVEMDIDVLTYDNAGQVITDETASAILAISALEDDDASASMMPVLYKSGVEKYPDAITKNIMLYNEEFYPILKSDSKLTHLLTSGTAFPVYSGNYEYSIYAFANADNTRCYFKIRAASRE